MIKRKRGNFPRIPKCANPSPMFKKLPDGRWVHKTNPNRLLKSASVRYDGTVYCPPGFRQFRDDSGRIKENCCENDLESMPVEILGMITSYLPKKVPINSVSSLLNEVAITGAVNRKRVALSLPKGVKLKGRVRFFLTLPVLVILTWDSRNKCW